MIRSLFSRCPPRPTDGHLPLPDRSPTPPRWLAIGAALVALCAAATPAWSLPMQSPGSLGDNADSASGGPIRLRSSQTIDLLPSDDDIDCSTTDNRRTAASPTNGTDRTRRQDATSNGQNNDNRDRTQPSTDRRSERARREPDCSRHDKPGEFELFVQELDDAHDIRRFGSDLMTEANRRDNTDVNPVVPADYLIKPGDELLVTLWGSVDADLRTVVDRSGRITIPRVGPVQVSGVRYADLPAVITQRVGQVFRNFQVSASLGQLRGVRVYVTGFVERPGAFTVSGLSTVVSALMRAGGPSAAGSFRDIELRRDGKLVASFDLYDFLLRGDRSADRLLQPGDVVHVGPVGAQVGVIGSVNRPAVFELRPGETVSDALRMAAGFTAVADHSRLAIERLEDRSSVRVKELNLPADGRSPVANGDVLRAFSVVDLALPNERQNKRVRVEGEVSRPGDYVLPARSSIADAIRAAGGLTTQAYVFGTEFTRESVRRTQQTNYDRALRDLETEFSRSTTSQRTSNAEEAAAQASRESATARLIQRLRAVRPTGRVILQLTPESQDLPALTLEDGDSLKIPTLPTTVGVFGSVFNAGSFLYGPAPVTDYVMQAGGPTRGADADSVFVLRANGSVVSGLQRRGFLGRGGGLAGVPAEPGDTIFMPEELNKTTFVQDAKDWTQIIYQFGLGLAAVIAISN